MTFLYILAAILMFGIMITVHEAGHFFAARLTHIPVREFAIGFGPKLLKWKRKKYDTEFFLRAIPLGGYCAFYGEDDTTGKLKADPRAFGRYPVWKRLLTIMMGSVMNIVLAFVVAILFFVIGGIPQITGPSTTAVQTVNDGSAAQAGGLLSGDVILSVEGVPVTDNLPDLISAFPGETPEELQFRVSRVVDGETREVTLPVTPVYDEQEGRSLIGILMTITPQVEMIRGSAGQVIKEAAELCYQAGSAIITAIRDLFSRGSGLGEVSGVVGITKMIVDEIQQTQLLGYLYLMIIISINLGLMNLLFIPGLDGSRIIFLLIEAVRGKPIEREGYIHAAGMILLFALMIFITFRDVIRLF